MVPEERLTGKMLEKKIVERFKRHRKNGEASVGRYGTQSSFLGHGEVVQMKSLPDFEGIVPPLSQAIFDAKVCSQASFDLGPYREENRSSKCRQLKHLMERAEYRCVTFFFIHWNRRDLKTKSIPPVTTAFPVHPKMPFWQAFFALEEKSISRQQALDLGYEVQWNYYNARCRDIEPNMFEACISVDCLLDPYR